MALCNELNIPRCMCTVCRMQCILCMFIETHTNWDCAAKEFSSVFIGIFKLIIAWQWDWVQKLLSLKERISWLSPIFKCIPILHNLDFDCVRMDLRMILMAQMNWNFEKERKKRKKSKNGKYENRGWNQRKINRKMKKKTPNQAADRKTSE